MKLGKLANRAKSVVEKKGDKIAAGVDKATDFVDKKTKGKYHDRLEKLDDAAARLAPDAGEKPGPDDTAGGAPPAP